MAATRTRRGGITALAFLASAALGLTACTGNAFGGDDAEVNTVNAAQASGIDEAIATAMQLSGADSAIVGIWSGAGEYVRAYGDDVSVSSPIRAAQASQPVMCALLLELVADGTVTLDREVSKDLPRQLGIEGVTYGMLCDASSGLADFKARISDIFANNPTRPWSDRELLTHALAHSPLSEPGAEQHVSDTDALLLARALRHLTGTKIDVLLNEHVFTTAEMASSWYPADPLTETTLPRQGFNGYTYPMSGGAPVCTVSTPVEGGEEGQVDTVAVEPVFVEQVSPSMLHGAGASVTTLTDLKRFYERYLSGGFGSEGSAGLVTSLWQAPAPSAESEEAPVEEAPVEGEEAAAPPSDGWTFGLEKHGNLFGMSGAMTGTLTAAYHDPNGGFTVVVTVNNSSAGAAFVRTLAFQLAAIAGANVEWTVEDQAAALTALAICQPPAPEGEGEEAPPVE